MVRTNHPLSAALVAGLCLTLPWANGIAMAAEAATADFPITAAGCDGSVVSHYSVNDAYGDTGMLILATRRNCKNSSGRASVGICQLDQTLKCRADIQFKDRSASPVDLSGYAVTKQGVAVAGVLHPWFDPQAASVIIEHIQATAARAAEQNQAVIANLGGQENFNQFLTASLCRIPLVAAGVLQPTAKERQQAKERQKNNIELTADTTPQNIDRCKTVTRNFCKRADLPPSITQMPDYRAVCDAPL